MKNPYVRILFASATMWFVNAQGRLCIKQHGSTSDTVVSDELLAAEHPLLPGALRLLVEKNFLKLKGSEELTLAEPRCAWYTCNLLSTPFIKIIDSKGKPQKISAVTSINTMDSEIGIVCSVLKTVRAKVNDTPVELVKSVQPTLVRLPKEKMETQFPGWTERCRIGQSLDLPLSHLSAYVLSNSPTATLPHGFDKLAFE